MDKPSTLTERLVADGCAAHTVTAPSANLIGALTRLADELRWRATTRVFEPGCRARRRAAEDEAAVRKAISLLRAQQQHTGEAA